MCQHGAAPRSMRKDLFCALAVKRGCAELLSCPCCPCSCPQWGEDARLGTQAASMQLVPSRTVTAHAYFMVNNGISLSILLLDFFPPCYVFRLNKCKFLGSLQLRGKDISQVSWLCPTVHGQRWLGCRCVGARACPMQIQTPANCLCKPIQGSECWLQLDCMSAACSCPHLCWWPLAERDGDRDGEHSPGITHSSACGTAPARDPSQGVGERISPNILSTVPIL